MYWIRRALLWALGFAFGQFVVQPMIRAAWRGARA